MLMGTGLTVNSRLEFQIVSSRDSDFLPPMPFQNPLFEKVGLLLPPCRWWARGCETH